MRERGILRDIPNFPKWYQTYEGIEDNFYIHGFWTISEGYIFQYSRERKELYYRLAIEHLVGELEYPCIYKTIPIDNFDFNTDPCVHLMEEIL